MGNPRHEIKPTKERRNQIPFLGNEKWQIGVRKRSKRSRRSVKLMWYYSCVLWALIFWWMSIQLDNCTVIRGDFHVTATAHGKVDGVSEVWVHPNMAVSLSLFLHAILFLAKLIFQTCIEETQWADCANVRAKMPQICCFQLLTGEDLLHFFVVSVLSALWNCDSPFFWHYKDETIVSLCGPARLIFHHCFTRVTGNWLSFCFLAPGVFAN